MNGQQRRTSLIIVELYVAGDYFNRGSGEPVYFRINGPITNNDEFIGFRPALYCNAES